MSKKQKPAEQPPAPEPVGEPQVGRPTTYRPEYAAQARGYCELGATDADLAEAFNVSTRTIANWYTRYPEFAEAVKVGKDMADDRVERSLYQKAIGYEYDAVKIFNANGSPMVVPYREKVAPDTTAAIFWLKNRRKDRWRDVHQHEHGKAGDFDQLDDEALREFIVLEAQEITGSGETALLPAPEAPKARRSSTKH